MEGEHPNGLEGLCALFDLKKKRAVEKHCRKLVVTGSDLANLILGGRGGALHPYRYACHFGEKLSPHLHPSDEEVAAMGQAKVGQLEGKARTFLRKIHQTFQERRLFAVHLFYVPSKRFWHLLYFDNRDRAENRNHWRFGPHIHYANDMYTAVPLDEVWLRAQTGDLAFLGAEHVRYLDPRERRVFQVPHVKPRPRGRGN